MDARLDKQDVVSESVSSWNSMAFSNSFVRVLLMVIIELER